MKFETLNTLGHIDNVEFVSVQKKYGSEDFETNNRLRIVRGQKCVSQSFCFAETAAVLSNCDLVVTCDSAVAHLAGAMGIPCWLMLCKIPDWRWGRTGEKTPWYKSIKILRQEEGENWTDVIKRVSKKLKDWSQHE